MAQLPPKIPTMAPACWSEFGGGHHHHHARHHHQHSPSAGTFLAAPMPPPQQQSSWVDEFLDFSAAKRRRSVAFLEPGPDDGNAAAGVGPHDFDRLDDDQLLSMFSDDLPPPPPQQQAALPHLEAALRRASGDPDARVAAGGRARVFGAAVVVRPGTRRRARRGSGGSAAMPRTLPRRARGGGELPWHWRGFFHAAPPRLLLCVAVAVNKSLFASPSAAAALPNFSHLAARERLRRELGFSFASLLLGALTPRGGLARRRRRGGASFVVGCRHRCVDHEHDETQQSWLLGPPEAKKNKYIDLGCVVVKRNVLWWAF